ncbi:FecR family protein [Tenacibaculum maritimum]|uniref:FecR family protein n=1 Tax=Tenacibaculum maritimum TaxID=107401 RepID=UPI00132F7A9C|nr:FecR family protein [Tenacibaculum maritimum]
MSTKSYNTVLDFLEDLSFESWAKNQKLSDKEFWDFWLNNNPEKRKIAYEAKDIILGIQFDKNNIPKEKVNSEWDKFTKRIQSSPLNKTKKRHSLKWLSIAASLLFFLTISTYIFTKPSYITHTTGYGEILDLKLQDGSTVKLNANSSISYSESNTRKLWLKGEAFFKVDKKHSTNAKFWVLTDDLEVEVYGTVFNVNTKRQKTQVYLEEGNIWLALKNGATKKMAPGNFISYSSEKNKILEEKELAPSNHKASWRNGKLTFLNFSLENAMKKITETYGYEVIFKEEISKNKLITGTVPNTNIDICLQAIEKSVNVKIKKEKDKLIIYNK